MARPAPRPRKYEMMIVVAPTVTEDGLPAVVERVSGLIATQDGEIESFTHDSPWGHRRLAYPIQNFRDAFYVLFYFHAVPRAIGELDRELRLDSTIIRHLIVKFDPLAYREIDTGPAGDDEDDVDDRESGGAVVAAAAEPDAEETVDSDEEAAEPDTDDEAADPETDDEAADDVEDEADEDEADDGDDDSEAEAEADDNDADDGEDEDEDK